MPPNSGPGEALNLIDDTTDNHGRAQNIRSISSLPPNSGSPRAAHSVLENGYEYFASQKSINLTELQRRFKVKTQTRPGTSCRGRPCRDFVGKKPSGRSRTKSRPRNRYPKFHLPGIGSVSAHRAAYALFVGGIPAGAEIDHVCSNNWCVEPEHLDAVPPEEHGERPGRRRPRRNRRDTPERLYVPPKIAARIDEIAPWARIKRQFVEHPLDAYAGASECAWACHVVDRYEAARRERQPPPGRVHAGILFVGRWASLHERMSAVVGTLLRCQIGARLLPLREVVSLVEASSSPSCHVLAIPDMPRSGISHRAAQALAHLIEERRKTRDFTLFAVSNLQQLEEDLGWAVAQWVKEAFMLLHGATSREEREVIVERARARCRQLGFSSSVTHSLVDVARCKAWAEARDDRRNVDAITLERCLRAAVAREVLLKGCEKHGQPRQEAERSLDDVLALLPHPGSPLLRLTQVARRLMEQLGEGHPTEGKGTPLWDLVERLTRLELRDAKGKRREPLRLVERYCSQLNLQATPEEQEQWAANALYEMSENAETAPEKLKEAIRNTVITELLVRACEEHGLEAGSARDVVCREVKPLRDRGLDALPKVAQRLLDTIEEILGQPALMEGPLVSFATADHDQLDLLELE